MLHSKRAASSRGLSGCGRRRGTLQFGQFAEDVVNSAKHKGQIPVVPGDNSRSDMFAVRSSGGFFSNSSVAESRIHFARGKFSSETQISNPPTAELPRSNPFVVLGTGGFSGAP